MEDVNVERLMVKLDQAKDVMSAARTAAASMQEAQTDMRRHIEAVQEARQRKQNAQTSGAFRRMKSDEEAAADAEAEARQCRTEDGILATLTARIERHRTAHEALAKRAQVWAEYSGALRALAQKHGVNLQ
ncbi:hypothetical protein WKW80_05220 [Variovorax humicola]|uniref:Uncharacterized protein n=1 Tax=Variovorax humicola TaxID=1769758 RepID=A0ABU8VUI5_9BURK